MVNNQAQQEQAALAAGQVRRERSNARQRQQSTETQTSTGSIALSRAIAPLTVGLLDWLDGSGAGIGKKFKPFFRLLSAELTATVIARAVLDGISRKRKRTALAASVGRAIQLEHEMQNFKKNHKALFTIEMIQYKRESYTEKERQILKDMRRAGVIGAAWSNRELVGIGMVALMLMEECTGMIKLYHTTFSNRKVGMIAPTTVMEEWLQASYAKDAIQGIIYEPMIEPPLDWINNTEGGYHLDTFQAKGFVNARRGGHYKNFTYSDCPEIFNGVNHIQRTPWKVNADVLQVMQHYWAEGIEVGGIPNPDLIPEPKAAEGIEGDARLAHYRDLQRIRALNSLNVSRRFRFCESLKMAEKFESYSEIYFPHHVDFRGRTYPIPQVFNPQGDDVAKGLLLFGEGKPIGNEGWGAYYVHAANLMGVKGSFNLRFGEGSRCMPNPEAWSPFDAAGGFDWRQASSPFQMLAWMFDHKRVKLGDENTLSYIPVAVDGSNNGLQLMSLLTLDKQTGEETNCTPRHALDDPADLYSTIADDVLQIIEEHPTEVNLALKDFGIDRSVMKPAILSFPYGVGFYTVTKMFQQQMYQRYIDTGAMPFNGKLRKHAIALATLTTAAINSRLQEPMGLMTWLKETARPALEAGAAISWVSPIGFRVHQTYKQMARRRIVTAVGSKIRKEAFYRDPLDTLSVSDNLNALVPNYIHSLDSSLLFKVTNEFCEDWSTLSLAMIHDSYATHACDMSKLARIVRDEAFKMFANNPLKTFDTDISLLYNQSSKTKRDLPKTGTLNLELLSKSSYFFH